MFYLRALYCFVGAKLFLKTFFLSKVKDKITNG
jgi:hypothetical protein